MDSQRFVQILQETIRTQNQLMYVLKSYIWEAENSHTPSCSLSAHHLLQVENANLKQQIKDLQHKLDRYTEK